MFYEYNVVLIASAYKTVFIDLFLVINYSLCTPYYILLPVVHYTKTIGLSKE